METDKTLRQRYRLAIAQQDEGLIYTETASPRKASSCWLMLFKNSRSSARRNLVTGSTSASWERR
jgi:hypothetical protein